MPDTMMTLQTFQLHFPSLRLPLKLCIVGLLLALAACASTTVTDQADFESTLPASRLEGDEEMLQALLTQGTVCQQPAETTIAL